MTQSPPPGWHVDPRDPQQKRFWSGSAWTDHVAPADAPPPIQTQGEWSPPGGSPVPYRGAPRAAPEVPWFRRPWVLIVGGVVALLIVIAAVDGSSSDGATQDPDALSPSTPAAPAAPTTVLNLSGNGDSQTQEFTVSDEWSISYNFDCSNFLDGSAGNFAITVEGSDGVPSLTNEGPNALASSGASTVYNHHGGTYYLSILSECNWTLSVTNG